MKRVITPTEQRLIRVFVVDDHQVVREGLRGVIDRQPDLVVAGEADTVASAMARLPTADADVAIIDLQLPDGSGADLCRYLATHHPATKCLVLSSFAHDEAVFQAIRAGAAGYIVKQIDSQTLVDCIRRAAAGELLLDRRTHVTMERRAQEDHVGGDLARLTAREREVLRYLADGLTNRQIAAQMHLSPLTVKNYVSNVMAKLHMPRRAGAAAYYSAHSARATN